ncbi:Malignant T cell-amplified sequence 1 [Myotis davidii]|uniref:Malignant T cell-amplified sequence 1 n=1 Tax=Myotis davidii TaxID=225400 RepID=L5M7Z7_MYODS|nr:Malignant T cell-amplified sequence 1 [Myotis davidii]
MFKKFDEKENVSNCIQLKTSVIKGIKNQLIEQFPGIEPWLNQIMPKKDPVKIVRCHEHIEILTVNGELLFFRQREGPFYPTLRLLHKYPFILPRQQVDKGAIKFVLSGANIMCPGLTSPGAKLYPAAADTVVAIMAEGKQHALCVGVMKMSAEDIEKTSFLIKLGPVEATCLQSRVPTAVAAAREKLKPFHPKSLAPAAVAWAKPPVPGCLRL